MNKDVFGPFRLLLAGLTLLASPVLWAQSPQTPFWRGFNLSGWFQGESAQELGNWYSITDLQNIVALGADHVRVPIDLYNLSGDGPDYVIDPILLMYLDRLVDWSETLNLYIILDYHPYVGLADDPANNERLIALWQQMAEHFKYRSDRVLYEIHNEPYGIPDDEWGELQRQVIEAIRAIDATHTLVVAPNEMSHFDRLELLPAYLDTNLIYTFHFYDPFLFTHQGTDWTDPSMENLTGVPYPYDAARMPAMPAEFGDTWLGQGWGWYPEAGTQAAIENRMDTAVRFRDSRQVPIHCGEFGVWQSGTVYEDRVQWYEDIGSYLAEDNIAWTSWGYKGGFGIYREKSPGNFPDDLDIPIVEALGLTAPESLEIQPDTVAIVIYDDLVGDYFSNGGFSGSLDIHDTSDPAQGVHALHWTGATQYGAIAWLFTNPRDLSQLADENYRIRFRIKTDSPGLRFDMRFLDTDLDDGQDHPWRLVKTIDSGMVPMDGQWHEAEFALSDMIDSGSWHNGTWYNPEGKFDWTRIDRIEIVAEHHDMTDKNLWLDDIQLAGLTPNTAVDADQPLRTLSLSPPYPNPFGSETNITYELPYPGPIEVAIYDILGRKVRSLVDGVRSEGSHTLFWKGDDAARRKLPPGTYVLTLKAAEGIRVQKVVLVK